MSIFKGSTAITRFTVSGLPEHDDKDITQHLEDTFYANSIQEINGTTEEFAMGWTNITTPFFPTFDGMSFIVGSYVTVSLRIDKKKIPAKVLEKEMKIAIDTKLKELQVPKLGRATLLEMKEGIKNRLLGRASAIPETFDIVWNVEEKTLYLLSTKRLAIEFLEDLFKENFGLDIEQKFAFTMAESTFEVEEIARLTPTFFA